MLNISGLELAVGFRGMFNISGLDLAVGSREMLTSRD
jgi:hypothetical protein